MTYIDRMSHVSPRLMAMGMMVLSSVGISFGGLIVRSMQEADAWQISFYRSVAYASVIAFVILWRYRGRVVPQIRAVGLSGVLAAGMSACAGMAFLQSLFHSSVATTLFIMAAIPFVTAFVAWLVLRERLAPITALTMAVAAAGVAIMVGDGVAAGSGYGAVMALVCVLCFSIYAVVLRYNRAVDMLPVLMFSGIFLAGIAAIARWGDLAVPMQDLILCLFLGGVLSAFGNLFFLAASRVLAAAELTMFMLLEFALGPIWVWVFVNEVPTGPAVMGGCLVILAVLTRAFYESKLGLKS
ncbi:MAG: DMT family transporter [Pseudoprimorskyibacter sp.]|nr:DMT family transporter [Pseudoprimorskyibacter sp.]